MSLEESNQALRNAAANTGGIAAAHNLQELRISGMPAELEEARTHKQEFIGRLGELADAFTAMADASMNRRDSPGEREPINDAARNVKVAVDQHLTIKTPAATEAKSQTGAMVETTAAAQNSFQAAADQINEMLEQIIRVAAKIEDLPAIFRVTETAAKDAELGALKAGTAITDSINR